MVRGQMPADLRRENEKTVLKLFQDNPRLSAVEISEKIGLSRQTVKKCIESFLEKGVLKSFGKGASSSVGGKRPEVYGLNDRILFASVVLHHHDFFLKVMDADYREIYQWESGETAFRDLDSVWDTLRKAAEPLEEDGTAQRVAAVCFVAPLGTDGKGNLTVATPFSHWPQSDFGRSLTEPLREFFPNAKYAEELVDGWCAGAGLFRDNEEFRKTENFATIYSSRGVGGGLFKNGNIQIGSNGLLGIWGHVIVEPGEKEQCSCGCYGCLEQQVSLRRMRDRLKSRPDAYRESILAEKDPDEVTFDDLFAGSDSGDAFCREESRYYAEIFSRAIHNAALLLSPDVICFQGNFGKADRVFREKLLWKLSQFHYIGEGKLPDIRYDDVSLSERETVGATYLMIKDYVENTERYI